MRHFALILLLVLPAAAQLSDGITTTVSINQNLTPDTADFGVAVTTPLDTTQQQVVQAMHDIGVQNVSVVGVGASLQGYFSACVYGDPSPAFIASQLTYQLAFSVAPSAMADFSKRLDGLRQKLPAGIAALQFNASLDVSTAAVDTARQAALTQMLQTARNKAQVIAAAAGLRLGAITAVAENTGISGGVSIPAVLSGVISSSNPFGTGGTQATFYATVKFAVQ